MINTRRFTVLMTLLAMATAAIAQNAASSPNSAAAGRFMALGEVREGMQGVARTVFSGTKPAEFKVEILGVLPGGVGPKQDLIIGRLSGGGADRTAVFAGMSGSPVYVDGKLIGAVSYSFPFSKEAICGITPIEQMIEIFEQKQPLRSANSGPRTVSYAELAGTEFPLGLEPVDGTSYIAGNFTNSAMASVGGQTMQRIATPITFAGFAQQTLDVFGPQMQRAGLLAVSAAGGESRIAGLKKADPDTLTGGTSVSMQLTRGDYSMAASGTVTLREGGRIYAFGHPFLSLGSADLPMAESHVVTVIPNLNNSFKLAVPDAMVGTMTQDRATGVFGMLGQAPKMIPVKIDLETSRGQKQEFVYEVARDDFLTPLLLTITIFNSAVAQERTIGDMTVNIGGRINVKGQSAIGIDRRFNGPQASQFAASAVSGPVNALLRSRFEGSDIENIELSMKTVEGSRTAVLQKLSIDRSQARPGETIDLIAAFRTDDGTIITRKIPFTIPASAQPGEHTLLMADGATIQQSAASQQFVPRNTEELIRTINTLKTADRFYLQLSRNAKGAIVGANEMPDLPPSVLATMNSERSSGTFKTLTSTAVAELELPRSEHLLMGKQSLLLEIIR